jgi:hypothetical protein
VAGMQNKLHSALASVTPSAVLAEQHRKMAEPGSARGEPGEPRDYCFGCSFSSGSSAGPLSTAPSGWNREP